MVSLWWKSGRGLVDVLIVVPVESHSSQLVSWSDGAPVVLRCPAHVSIRVCASQYPGSCRVGVIMVGVPVS